MYKLLAAVVLVLGLGSCVSSQKAGQRASERQEVRRQVDEALDSRSFTVTFDYVMPHRLPARYLTTTYSLTVNGDSIDSYLPYFGVAYRSKYPDDMRSPLIFSGRATGSQLLRVYIIVIFFIVYCFTCFYTYLYATSMPALFRAPCCHTLQTK